MKAMGFQTPKRKVFYSDSARKGPTWFASPSQSQRRWLSHCHEKLIYTYTHIGDREKKSLRREDVWRVFEK
jgi:hypothetical protein